MAPESGRWRSQSFVFAQKMSRNHAVTLWWFQFLNLLGPFLALLKLTPNERTARRSSINCDKEQDPGDSPPPPAGDSEHRPPPSHCATPYPPPTSLFLVSSHPPPDLHGQPRGISRDVRVQRLPAHHPQIHLPRPGTVLRLPLHPHCSLPSLLRRGCSQQNRDDKGLFLGENRELLAGTISLALPVLQCA